MLGAVRRLHWSPQISPEFDPIFGGIREAAGSAQLPFPPHLARKEVPAASKAWAMEECRRCCRRSSRPPHVGSRREGEGDPSRPSAPWTNHPTGGAVRYLDRFRDLSKVFESVTRSRLICNLAWVVSWSMPRRFTISKKAVAPPLSFGETARKYGVPKAEVKRVRTFLEHSAVGGSAAAGSRKGASARMSRRKTRARRVATKRSR